MNAMSTWWEYIKDSLRKMIIFSVNQPWSVRISKHLRTHLKYLLFLNSLCVCQYVHIRLVQIIILARGISSLWSWGSRHLCACSVLVLGVELRSSAKAVHVFNCWVVSPAPYLEYTFKKNISLLKLYLNDRLLCFKQYFDYILWPHINCPRSLELNKICPCSRILCKFKEEGKKKTIFQSQSF